MAWTRNFLAADWIPALSVGDNGMRSTRLREDYRRNLQEPQMQTMFLCAGSASIHGLAELFLHSHDQPRGREHVRWATQRQQSTGVGNTGDTLTQLPSVSRRPQRMPLLEGECKAGENLISKDSISYQETSLSRKGRCCGLPRRIRGLWRTGICL